MFEKSKKVRDFFFLGGGGDFFHLTLLFKRLDLSGELCVLCGECLERVGLLHPERVAAGGAAEDKDGAVAHLCTDERRKRTSVESRSRL